MESDTMSKEICLSDSVSDLYNTEIDNNEFAFIYLGYAGILLRTGTSTITFDPANYLSKVKSKITSLDFITYSHSHYDHFTFSDAVSLFKSTNAHILSEFSMIEELQSKIPHNMITSGPETFRTVRDELVVNIDGIRFKMHRGVHPRPIIQFRVKLGKVRIFHGADSGYWPVGKQAVDVAFIPTGRPSPTCAPGVGLAMVMDIKPKYAVAIHGSDTQCKKFRDLVEHEVPETTVIIPKVNELIKLTTK